MPSFDPCPSHAATRRTALLGTLDFVLRKLAHMTEYALLTLLWAWSLIRRWGAELNALVRGRTGPRDKWRAIWRRRGDWLKGY